MPLAGLLDGFTGVLRTMIRYLGRGNKNETNDCFAYVPDPTINKDKDLLDISTGIEYRSDGTSWVVTVPPRKPGETIPEYLNRMGKNDPLGIRDKN
jgi:hypothetical protein